MGISPISYFYQSQTNILSSFFPPMHLLQQMANPTGDGTPEMMSTTFAIDGLAMRRLDAAETANPNQFDTFHGVSVTRNQLGTEWYEHIGDGMIRRSGVIGLDTKGNVAPDKPIAQYGLTFDMNSGNGNLMIMTPNGMNQVHFTQQQLPDIMTALDQANIQPFIRNGQSQ